MNIEQITERLEKVLKELKTERDNLKVQLHLLNMDAKEEWNELENKYENFKAKASIVAEATEDSTGEVVEALKLVGEELHEGYKRIKRSM
jgi:restriction endonuclease S subunit